MVADVSKTTRPLCVYVCVCLIFVLSWCGQMGVCVWVRWFIGHRWILFTQCRMIGKVGGGLSSEYSISHIDMLYLLFQGRVCYRRKCVVIRVSRKKSQIPWQHSATVDLGYFAIIGYLPIIRWICYLRSVKARTISHGGRCITYPREIPRDLPYRFHNTSLGVSGSLCTYTFCIVGRWMLCNPCMPQVLCVWYTVEPLIKTLRGGGCCVSHACLKYCMVGIMWLTILCALYC